MEANLVTEGAGFIKETLLFAILDPGKLFVPAEVFAPEEVHEPLQVDPFLCRTRTDAHALIKNESREDLHESVRVDLKLGIVALSVLHSRVHGEADKLNVSENLVIPVAVKQTDNQVEQG